MGFEDGMGNLPAFDSVREFLASRATHGRAFTKNRRFFGTLRKKTVSSKGSISFVAIRYAVLEVTHIVNRDRPRNWDTFAVPPPRTGLFDAFMDEVENSAREAGFSAIRVDLVSTEFLRPKFKRRGYRIISSDGNPSYYKYLPPLSSPQSSCVGGV